MADNVPITAGTGTNIATDQLAGGEHVQYVKLMDGTLDGSGKIAGDATNGLDVDVTRLPADVALADNTAFTDGTTKVQAAGYVFDEVAGSALTEDDAAAARIDSKRAQVLVLEDATTRGRRATVSAAGAVSVDTEFGSAFSAADATLNASMNSPAVQAANAVYNGATWDRVRSVEALAAAPNVPTGIQAAGIGPGFDIKLNPTNLATLVNSVVTQVVNGADVILIHVGTGTTGTIAIEVSGDDAAWIAAAALDTQTDLWATGNLTPTNGKTYLVRTGGWRQLRVRTASTLGTTVALKFTLSVGPQILRAIDTGPAPHNIGYTITWKQVEATTTQTGTAIWTPASGKKVVITRLLITTGGTTAGVVTVWWGASGDTTFSQGTDQVAFRGEFAPSATVRPGYDPGGICLPGATADHVLRYTTSAAMTVYITVWGYEI